MTAGGTVLDIVACDVLEGLPGASSLSTWDGYGVLVDPEDMSKVVFGGDDLVFAQDVQFKEEDGVVDAYLSDVGFDPGNPNKHGAVVGVAG